MDKRTIHNLVWIPVCLIGVIAIALGSVWCLHPEPWLLDQSPNEALLQTSFNNLFSKKVNIGLPNYLKVIYRFLGLWLLSLGLLIIIFVQITRLGTKQAQKLIYVVIFFVLLGIYYLVLNYLPTSPLLPVLYMLTLLFFCSFYFSFQLGE